MNSKFYFIISGVIFAGVSLLHLVRSINGWQFQIGPFQLQNWLSYLGFVLAAALSVWAFRLVSQGGKTSSGETTQRSA